MRQLQKARAILLPCLLLFAASLLHGSTTDRLTKLISQKDLDWNAQRIQLLAEGANPGLVYEALIVRFSRTADVDGLIAINRLIESNTVTLPSGKDNFFKTEDERAGFLAALSCIDASRWKQFDSMRSHAKISYEKNPQAFKIFELEDLLKDAMDLKTASAIDVTIDMSTRLIDPKKGDITLEELCENKKALYIDFWASWCGPCIRSMPELKNRADAYQSTSVAVLAVNTDQSNQIKHAADTKKRFGMDMPWLLEDQTTEPLSKPLKITSIPRVVLIASNGQILYNGHPADLELKLALLDLGIAP